MCHFSHLIFIIQTYVRKINRENSDLGAELISDLFAEADKGEAAKRIVKTGGSTLNTPYAAGLTGVYNAGIAYINMTDTTYGSITYYVIGQPKMYLASKSAGTWSRWNAITTSADFQCGNAALGDCSAGKITDFKITFPKAFSTIPYVIVCLRSTSTSEKYGLLTPYPTDITTKGFTFRVANAHTTTLSPGGTWYASI